MILQTDDAAKCCTWKLVLSLLPIQSFGDARKSGHLF